jgi:hypothetical protein
LQRKTIRRRWERKGRKKKQMCDLANLLFISKKTLWKEGGKRMRGKQFDYCKEKP